VAGLLDLLSEQAMSWSWLELVAVVAAILYLLLAIQQNILCWLFALLSTAIYVALFIDARLYMESALNAFYFGMGIYGWYTWRHGGDNDLPVTTRPASFHALAVVVLASGAIANGWLLARYTDAAFPFVDSLTTWAALWATWLVARKIFENWWYWLAIDSVSIVIYWSRGLELTALLFVVYVAMIPFGIVAWRKSLCRVSPEVSRRA
jgi:nicotinamide mononucleotide transporter